MRALDASPPPTIAAVTGLSVATVRILHSRFLREGESCLTGRPGRGGRRRGLLTAEQRAALLARYTAAAQAGELVEAGVVRRDYEAVVGHKIAASTVYRLLAHAGWRKIAPRRSHPEKDEAAFKKTSRKR